MGHLFISYSRKDQSQVHQLIQRLEDAGHHVWIDNQGLQVGDEFPERIQDAIRECQGLILVLSQNSVTSEWVKKEIKFARSNQKKLFPVNLDGTKLGDHFGFPLSDEIQQQDLSDDFDIGVMTLLQVLSGAPTAKPKNASDVCPYKGLEFFDCNDEDPKYFFGREALVSRLIEHVRGSNFLALVGASGNGKSSVLRAGLLHQLKQGQLIEGSDRWRIRVTRPEQEPMTNLAMAFVREGLSELDRAGELEKAQERLDKGAAGLKRLIQVAPQPRVILVIDQFEEVFTQCENDKERDQYLATLMGALEGTEEKLCLIIAMRSDFLGKCVERNYSGLAQVIGEQMIPVLPLEPDELKSAIFKPAEAVGLDIEGELVTQIINDIHGAPGSLPLLQYALKELWQDRQDNRLQLHVYQSLGGIQGTLDKRATAIYENFNEAEQQTVRHIFQQLTQLGEGTEDTRRRVYQQDLVSEPKHPEEQVLSVITKLSGKENRLLVTSDAPERPSEAEPMAIVDVAHEVLIRNWKLLQDWIAQDREMLLKQRRIEASTISWRNQGEQKGDLLLGKPLIEAKDFNQRQADTFPLSETARTFIAKSLRQRRWNRFKMASWLIIPAVIISGIVDFNLRENGVNADYGRLDLEGTYEEKHAAEALVKGCSAQKQWSWIPKYLSERFFGNCRSLFQAPLQEAQLSGADLGSADLSNAKLSNAELSFADLSFADLGSADLSNAKLSNAKLSNAELFYAKLSNAKLLYTDLSNAKLSNAKLSNAKLSNAKLLYSDLSDADLSKAYLHNAKLSDADLSNADLSKAKLSETDLSKAKLRNANLSFADLSKTFISNTDLSFAHLYNANLSFAELYNADLSNATLNVADLSDVILGDANLSFANLNFADLRDAKLSDVNLHNANLSSADLRDAKLHNAKLSGTDLSNANLSNANLRNADLSNADLSNTKLSDAIFLGTDLRQTKELTPKQFKTQNPPLLCNSPLPKDIEINPDRDCDKLPKILAKRYPWQFDTLERATEYVNEQRKKTWD